MLNQTIDCIVASAADTRPIHVVRPDGLKPFLATLPPAQADFLRDTGFAAKSRRASAPARPNRRRGRRARHRRRCLALRLRRPARTVARLRRMAAGTRRLRSRRGKPGLLPWRLSLQPLPHNAARPVASLLPAAGSSRQRRPGRRHLDGARPDQHPRQHPRTRRTGRLRRSCWQRTTAPSTPYRPTPTSRKPTPPSPPSAEAPPVPRGS